MSGFAVGDRVVPSEQGIKIGLKHYREGNVVGFKGNGVLVQWDFLLFPSQIHPDFIEHINHGVQQRPSDKSWQQRSQGTTKTLLWPKQGAEESTSRDEVSQQKATW